MAGGLVGREPLLCYGFGMENALREARRFKLCPIGIAGDEPMDVYDPLGSGFDLIGTRQAVWYGFITREQGEAIYPSGDWSRV